MGIAVAAIPGAIFFEVVRRTIVYSFWQGVKVALGEFIGHLTALVIIFFGIRTLINSSLDVPYAVFYLLGALLTGWLGIVALKVKKTDLKEKTERKISSREPILIGFLVSITDPFILALWVSLAASTLSHVNILDALSQIVAVSLGFLMFFLIVSSLVKVTTTRLNMRYVVWFSSLSGVALLYTAFSFLYKAAQVLGVTF